MESPPNGRGTARSLQRFSLRTMMLVITLFAIGMGVYHGYVVPFRLEEEAGLALNQKGASLEWEPAKPLWLRATMRTFFPQLTLNHCVAVRGDRTQIEDDDLRHLRNMPYVERLYLARTRISDEGLKNLGGLKRLKRLSLYWRGSCNIPVQNRASLYSLLRECWVVNPRLPEQYAFKTVKAIDKLKIVGVVTVGYE